MTIRASQNAVKSIMRRASVTPQTPLNIITFCTHERYEQNLCKTGNNFYSIKAGKAWDTDYGQSPENYFEIEEIPHHVDYDLILLQTNCNRLELAKKLKALFHVPIIRHTHVLPDIRYDIESQLQAFANAGLEAGIDRNTFISEFSRNAWGLSVENSSFINHGIDTEFWNDSGEEKRNATCLSVVNLWPDRDWCCGWQLWNSIIDSPTKGKLPITVVGKNDKWGLSSAASSLEELRTRYSSSLIFLNTSLHSPVPMSLLEAMACGCAIVSTATCMVPEIIEHGHNGLLSNDPNQLREYCEELLKNPDKAKELGKNAQKTIREKYNIDEFTKHWNNIFYKAIQD
tara:strand:- start:9587 stop:10615 length:1029 start_codon:yes stop_codon:yes gene_type:complete